MSAHPRRREFFILLVLGFLTSVGPFSTDLYLPTFPQLAESLNTTLADISYSLASFFIGLAVGQMLYGPLLERFGRKKPIYWGLVLYAIASYACTLAQDVNQLIFLRFFQAMGGAVGLVAARAIVRDLYDGIKMARVFSNLIMVVAASPILAPTVGGYLSEAFGWESTFITLLVMAFGILAGTFFILPETHPEDANYSMNMGVLAKNFLEIFRHPEFFFYALTAAASYAGIIAYVSGAPHLFMERLGFSEQEFGFIFAANALGIISATQINNRLLKRFSPQKIIQTAMLTQIVFAILFLGVNVIGNPGLLVNMVLIIGYLSCIGFISPNASALSLQPMAHAAGNASALMGSIQMIAGAGASALVGFLQNQMDNSIPMAVSMALSVLVASFLFFLGKKRIPQALSNSEA